MKEDLKKLYSKLILEKQQDTTGFEKREDASHILEAYNPLCGDQFKLYLDLQDGQLVKASYHGYGCALSKVSTALLIERLQGKSIDESKELILDYFNDLKSPAAHSDEIIKALARAKSFPGREQCTVLSWKAAREFFIHKT